jgi:hypothetical protein
MAQAAASHARYLTLPPPGTLNNLPCLKWAVTNCWIPGPWSALEIGARLSTKPRMHIVSLGSLSAWRSGVPCRAEHNPQHPQLPVVKFRAQRTVGRGTHPHTTPPPPDEPRTGGGRGRCQAASRPLPDPSTSLGSQALPSRQAGQSCGASGGRVGAGLACPFHARQDVPGAGTSTHDCRSLHSWAW